MSARFLSDDVSETVKKFASEVSRKGAEAQRFPDGNCRFASSRLGVTHCFSSLSEITGLRAGWHASGSAGVPPAVLCVPRSTRRMSTGVLNASGVRVYSAGREIRQAGRPRYPRHAARLHASDDFHEPESHYTGGRP